MMLRSLLPALTHLLVYLTTLDAAHVDVEQDKYAQSLASMLEAKNGYFHPKLELRRTNLSDPSSTFGMFAKEDIKANSLLFKVPTNAIIDSIESLDDQPPQTSLVCGTVRNLAQQFKLGNESEHAEYVNYLLDTQPPDLIPSAWSTSGKSLLVRFLQGVSRSDVKLPPEYPIEWISDDWRGECGGSKDPLEERAALLVIQRAWDHLMIPVYDMMNHRNGESVNTMSNNARLEGAVRVQAKRDIKAGEEIYTTYNMCEDCEERANTFGTPEILRDYGFVEQYPQSWIFESIDVAFRIDEVNGDLEVTEWIQGGEVDDEDSYEALLGVLDEVVERKELLLEQRNEKVPEHEWNTITVYADAMELAIKTALASANVEDLECIEKGTCKVAALTRYKNLDDKNIVFDATELTGLTWPTCNVDALMQQFDDDGAFELIEEIKSPYQQMSFMRRPDNHEACFDIDNTIQICDAYRPHYHELQVHQAARYLKEMKRVLWVGGGDSMLLHEFLKYPGLELAVGLELDQRVVRGSFKHFGTQPKFEDDRVEWWFGDATKSLMMLPKDYFGSFDMVVVDLSETVMSLTVTDELDVIEALTLLLKPDGVFIKNEKYFHQFEKMFPYSVQMFWNDNPVICSQLIALGSYSVDFMKTEQKDFGVEAFLVDPLESTDPFELYHDYAHNHTSRQICDVLLSKGKTDETEQQSSPGILFIVEAEDATFDLSNSDAVKGILHSALEKEGLTVVSSTVTPTEFGSIITLVFEEGYLVARVAPDRKYCGFDLHFWTSFGKHKGTKNAMVAAVGSTESSTSTYRIIVGGIFGMPSWQDEDKNRGPQYHEICEQRSEALKTETDPSVASKKMGAVKQSTIDSMLEESISLIPKDSKKIAALVGNDGKSDLSPAFNNAENVKLETIYCPSMLNFNEYDDDALDSATTCENHLTNTLRELAKEDAFNVLIIDSTADKFTASILLNIFSARRKRFAQVVLEENVLVVSLMLDDSEHWRQHLLKHFKNDVFKLEPTFYTEMAVSDSTGAMKVLLANDSDAHFVQRLNKAVIAHEKKSGLSIEVEVLEGGQFVYQEDPFEPTRSFLPSDYDQTSPLEQWKSQVPLGHQVIFQMEYEAPSSKLGVFSSGSLSADIVKDNLEAAISKTAISGLELSENTIKEQSIGDGIIFVATWSGGSIVVLWDGRKHIDVNFFTYEQNTEQSHAFEANFRTSKKLSTRLRDEQPRGVGRVVSYFDDLKGAAEVPEWALKP